MDPNDYFDRFELADLFDAVEGQAQSDGGLVTVRIDSRGRVREISLDSKLSGIDADQLGEAIATVCGRAFDNRIERLADVLAEYERKHELPREVLSFLHNSIASLRPTSPAIEVDSGPGDEDDDDPVVKSVLR
ncbi:hypothetical protein A5634_03535 [Mycobacterium asiaticum]|uniref:DNA-binding protein n=1 Tax=Mycobacterium asiaticum TaxID=1790 RepID=A0A1A3NSQ3_MYCAS|nr:YbaB/EbfC family nucleoid-associated protein [Mycobacterium asiaticum]OBK24410.1 hypothetical protein A5634_03535 [Mycobacterium asiaticum]